MHGIRQRIRHSLFTAYVCRDRRAVLLQGFLHVIEVIADGKQSAQHRLFFICHTFCIFEVEFHFIGIEVLVRIILLCNEIRIGFVCHLIDKLLRGVGCSVSTAYRDGVAAAAGYRAVIKGVAIGQIPNGIGTCFQCQGAVVGTGFAIVAQLDVMNGRDRIVLAAEHLHIDGIVFDGDTVIAHSQRIVKDRIDRQRAIGIDFFLVDWNAEAAAGIFLQIDLFENGPTVVISCLPVCADGKLLWDRIVEEAVDQRHHVILGCPDQFTVFVHDFNIKIVGAGTVGITLQHIVQIVSSLAGDLQFFFRLQFSVHVKVSGVGCLILGKHCVKRYKMIRICRPAGRRGITHSDRGFLGQVQSQIVPCARTGFRLDTERFPCRLYVQKDRAAGLGCRNHKVVCFVCDDSLRESKLILAKGIGSPNRLNGQTIDESGTTKCKFDGLAFGISFFEKMIKIEIHRNKTIAQHRCIEGRCYRHIAAIVKVGQFMLQRHVFVQVDGFFQIILRRNSHLFQRIGRIDGRHTIVLLNGHQCVCIPWQKT